MESHRKDIFVEEVGQAFSAMERLTRLLNEGRPEPTKEQLIRKRAKLKKQKRKRGGPK